MCLEVMDTNTKHAKTNFWRRNMKLGSNLRWKLLRVTEQEEGEAHRLCRASSIRGAIRRQLRREQRRAQLQKLSKALEEITSTEKRDATIFEESQTMSHPAGAMAPVNTTQYLMAKVYEDMMMNKIETVPASTETHSHLYGECLSPSSVYAALDADYDSCLVFQERDFEEAFDQC